MARSRSCGSSTDANGELVALAEVEQATVILQMKCLSITAVSRRQESGLSGKGLFAVVEGNKLQFHLKVISMVLTCTRADDMADRQLYLTRMLPEQRCHCEVWLDDLDGLVLVRSGSPSIRLLEDDVAHNGPTAEAAEGVVWVSCCVTLDRKSVV